MSNVFIIAEAGVNHNGDIEIAKKLVDKAVEAGADAVKFQTFKAHNLVSKDAKKARYQIMAAKDKKESQLEMLQKLELSAEKHEILINYCKEKNIEFLSTPFDCESIKLLVHFGLKILKIPSGEITNYPYLCEIAKTKKDIIMSTGMSSLSEVEAAVQILKTHGSGKLTLLHCNSEYPTSMKDVNLNAMLTLKEKFHLEVGYSDHTQGIEVPIAAVAMGASVIEKHFTLDKTMDGPDHKASLEPEELKQMVRAIRNIEAALGSGEKTPSESEIPNRDIVRKSIVASKKIKSGEIFSEDNLTTKRPGNGISPMMWEKVLGQAAKRDYGEDELIEL